MASSNAQNGLGSHEPLDTDEYTPGSVRETQGGIVGTMSSKRGRTKPRIVRLSESALKEQPRSFKMTASEGCDAQLLHEPGRIESEAWPKDDKACCQQKERQQLSGLVAPVKWPGPARPLSPQKLVPDKTPAADGMETSSQTNRKRRQCYVNNNLYTKLDCIGRGGSCRVYRVLSPKDEILALKRVNIRGMDETAVMGYKNEIELLHNLAHSDKVVQLRDWQLNHEKQTLFLVMELGELDFDHALKCHLTVEGAKFDLNFIRHFWKEMLECVAVVHALDIVHADLKPANFVIVGTHLKIIDFGIANLIGDHTVNVHRDHQTGTPNYMAPEALLDTNSSAGSLGNSEKLIKMGKPSDIWSLGCILYQMVYGKAPFAHIQNHIKRAMAIINPAHAIEFPLFGLGGAEIPENLLWTVKSCLSREQSQRPPVVSLLSCQDKFLHPDWSKQTALNMSEEQLGTIISDVVQVCRTGNFPTNDEVLEWSDSIFHEMKLTD